MARIKRVMFTKEMKKTHTILIPTMLPVHFEIIGGLLEQLGYKVKLLTNNSENVIIEGLKNVHNDMCYPALLVIGQMIDALKNETIPKENLALLITQTGGGCRASNYIYLLRKALVNAGYEDIPLISASFLKDEQSTGFSYPKTFLLKAFYAIICGDLIMTLANQCKPYEITKGDTDSSIKKAVKQCLDSFKAKKIVTQKYVDELQIKIIDIFKKIKVNKTPKIKVGIVGEIYIKYSPLGNNDLENFLIEQGCEVVCPGLYDFLLYCFRNNIEDNIRYGKKSIKSFLVKKSVKYLINLKTRMINIIKNNSSFVPPTKFEDIIKCADGYIDRGVKMGEGWLLTAEMIELIHSQKVNNIVCAQPFGCLPNHVVGKGMIRGIKLKNPDANIISIDYDASSSKVNQQNRIKLMLENAKI